MNRTKFGRSPRVGALLRGACYAALVAVILVLIVFTAMPSRAIYVIYDEEYNHVLETDDGLIKAVSQASTVEPQQLSAADTVTRRFVTIHCDETTTTIATTADTPEAMLAEAGITLGENDIYTYTTGSRTDDIHVSRVTVEEGTVETEIPYETIRKADPSMDKGTEKVVTAGQNGKLIETYQYTTTDGVTEEVLMSTETVDPVTEVIAYGTKVKVASSSGSGSMSRTSEAITNVDSENRTFTTTAGNTYSYSRVLTCSATAYSIPGGTTATGTAAREGAIAVDPSVIPYGSRLYIVTSTGSVIYGFATAEDTGGAIRGNRIDLFYDSTSTCYAFGNRTCTVYILN